MQERWAQQRECMSVTGQTAGAPNLVHTSQACTHLSSSEVDIILQHPQPTRKHVPNKCVPDQRRDSPLLSHLCYPTPPNLQPTHTLPIPQFFFTRSAC